MLLKYDKIYNFFNEYMQALKNGLLTNEELTNEELKDISIPIELIEIRFNDGRLDKADYTVSGRVFTITNADVDASECTVFADGLQIYDFTVTGNEIAIPEGDALTEFDIKLHSNVGNYLQGQDYSKKYVTQGVVENLGIQLIDTRVLAYMQTVSVGITAKADDRNNIMILCEKFARELNDVIYKTEQDEQEYSLHIRCTQMPDYSQNYKAHGIEEFNTSILFDIRITQNADYSIEEELYIDNVLIPFSTLATSKTVETEPDLRKESFAKVTASRNICEMQITGFTYDNAVLQALKNQVRDFEQFETVHTVRLQKGLVIDGNVESDDITVPSVDNLHLYYDGVKLVLGTDYSITGLVITILNEDVVTAEVTVLQGEYAFLYQYEMIMTEGAITNTYGGSIDYAITLQVKR